MKTSKNWQMIIVMLITILSACSKTNKNTSTPKPEITPIKYAESQTVYYYRYLDNGYSTSYEHGITFSANANGKITKVGGKTPKSGITELQFGTILQKPLLQRFMPIWIRAVTNM